MQRSINGKAYAGGWDFFWTVSTSGHLMLRIHHQPKNLTHVLYPVLYFICQMQIFYINFCKKGAVDYFAQILLSIVYIAYFDELCTVYIYILYTKHHPIEFVYIHQDCKFKIDLGNPLLILKYYTISVYIQYICTLIVQWTNNGDCEAVCEKCLYGSQMKSGLLYY